MSSRQSSQRVVVAWPLLIVLLLLLTLCVVLPVCALTVALVSDVHYDPAYGTPDGFVCTDATRATYGEAGCDAPPALMHALRDELRAQRVAHLFFGGDWHRHRFDPALFGCGDIVAYLSRLFVDVVPSPANVTTTLGNNDMVPNYGFDVRASSHPQLECEVAAMADAGIVNASEAAQMRVCGYYAHDAGTAVVVVLHTLVWTHAIVPPVPDDAATDTNDSSDSNNNSSSSNDPCGQFAFLDATLAAARAARRPVIVLGHIPPSANVYDIVRHNALRSSSSDLYWKDAYRQRYEALLSAYADVVRLQLFGHTHALALLATTSDVARTPALVMPAYTPNYANYPSYLLASFSDDGNWTLQALQQRYVTADGQWHDGLHVVGALALRRGAANASDAQRVLSTLLYDDALWDNYLQLRGGGVAREAVFPRQSCDAFCRAVSVCGMLNNTFSALRTCVVAGMSSQLPHVDVHAYTSAVTVMLLLGVPLLLATALASIYVTERIRSGNNNIGNNNYGGVGGGSSYDYDSGAFAHVGGGGWRWRLQRTGLVPHRRGDAAMTATATTTTMMTTMPPPASTAVSATAMTNAVV